MDLSNINAITIEEVLRDYTSILGHLAVKRSAIILNPDGSARHMIIDMQTWELFNQGFTTVYTDDGQAKITSPEGHEEIFTKIGNYIYDHLPAICGLEAAEELLSKRQ